MSRENQLDGRLVTCPESEHGGKVFFVENGKRHWVPSVDHLAHYGRELSETVQVSLADFRTLANAGNLPRIWATADRENPDRSSPTSLREIAASQLSGVGIEFGAGSHPFCLPLHCRVTFADFVPESLLRGRAYPAQGSDFVPLTYVTSMEQMDGIADGSLDFLVASHVIEHLKNPLRALAAAHAKLKSGGSLLLVVPDQRITFDRNREVTPLEHLIADYQDPSPARDHEHFVEFFAKVHNFQGEELDAHVKTAIAEQTDIHFHTWTFESFQRMIDYCQQSVCFWKSVWRQPAIEGLAESHEFYYVLER